MSILSGALPSNPVIYITPLERRALELAEHDAREAARATVDAKRIETLASSVAKAERHNNASLAKALQATLYRAIDASEAAAHVAGRARLGYLRRIEDARRYTARDMLARFQHATR